MPETLDFPFDMAEIKKVARSIRVSGVELSDLVSETCLGLLVRVQRNPEAASHPGRAIRFAATDALRSLTQSRVVRNSIQLEDWARIAAVGVDPDPEAEDPCDVQSREQWLEWRSLTVVERLKRISESEVALGSSRSVSGSPILRSRSKRKRHPWELSETSIRWI